MWGTPEQSCYAALGPLSTTALEWVWGANLCFRHRLLLPLSSFPRTRVCAEDFIYLFFVNEHEHSPLQLLVEMPDEVFDVGDVFVRAFSLAQVVLLRIVFVKYPKERGKKLKYGLPSLPVTAMTVCILHHTF